MAHMSTEIAHRDEAIIAQGKLLEERFGAMEEMGREIHGREQIIAELSAETVRQRAGIARLMRTPWNRIRRWLGGQRG